MRSARKVSASTEPMMKAPSAALKPAVTARPAIARHRATLTTSRVSSFSRRRVRSKKVGMRKMPPPNQSARYSTSLPISRNSAVPSNCRPTATVLNSTSSRMATRSSITNAPITSRAKPRVFNPSSSNARTMMVVELMDRMPPRNTLSMPLQPRSCPVAYPAPSMKSTVVIAVTAAAPPTCINFLKLNSSPRPKSRKMTPISDQVRMFASSVTVGTNFTWGPTRKPATM